VIDVRPARQDDDVQLMRIDDATWSSAVSPAPLPPPGRRFFDEDRSPRDVLVAEVGGAVAGYVSLGGGFDIPAHAHVRELTGLAVAPEHGGRGVGRALVEAAVAEAGRRGARKVTLRVLGHNTLARRLYAACGFTVEGVLRGEFRLDGRDVDDVLMARHLAGSET
jgi:ribosomal protein S18 acetylase RimI-like enzyme